MNCQIVIDFGKKQRIIKEKVRILPGASLRSGCPEQIVRMEDLRDERGKKTQEIYDILLCDCTDRIADLEFRSFSPSDVP